MHNRKVLKSMCIAEKVVTTMMQYIRTVIDTYENNIIAIELRDKETQDLLHEIELSQLSPAGCLRLMRELKRVREERRRMKDENETLIFLYEMLKEYPKLKDSLKKTHKQISVQKNRQAIRVYVPRVRTDLKICKAAGDKL
ncbi:MAG: hypothetical protein JL50_03080 [Peptococcaceae bacterium BICA1-7]|nr:MAG: hypothetical protein JL50_03080 [Peptococcaceae bacterium BICA1-7]HBV97752.1 hypothetical protein [Desulfotomaculum sp.]